MDKVVTIVKLTNQRSEIVKRTDLKDLFRILFRLFATPDRIGNRISVQQLYDYHATKWHNGKKATDEERDNGITDTE